MSEAIDRILDLRRAGFGFLHHRDEQGEIVVLQAVRVRAGHIETVLIYGEHEALAARCRDENHPALVWHQAGRTAKVVAELLDLPAPAARHAPALARTAPTDLWLPRDFTVAAPRGLL